jgi:eukaryotic translation initiation factor 2C
LQAPYGFNIIGKLMTVPVRYAPPPKVTYAGGATVDSRKGSWNLRGVKHYRRAAITKGQIWVTIDNKDERNLVENFRNLLETELGMRPRSIEIVPFVDDTNLTVKLTELGNKGAEKGAEFVILINPWEQKGAYDEFRRMTDRVWGIPSICITWIKLWSNREGHRLPGFVANNAMKVNSRMNGINHISDFEKNLPMDVKMAETIIIGADVSHPGFGASPGTGSIAAMVGTMDPRGQLYAGSARPNEPKIEASIPIMKRLRFKMLMR